MNLSTAAQSALRRVVHFPRGADLPTFDYVELPGRGRTYAARVDGPQGAPTLFLCHALGCTASLTWFGTIAALREHYNLVLMDMRWHGRGISDGRFFRLSDCADDWVALADVLGIESFIPVGYSMGGVVAQVLWRRHADRVAGLVLCSTAGNWHDTRRERAFFSLLPTVTVPMALRRKIPTDRPLAELPAALTAATEDAAVRRWALAEFRSTKVSSLMAALNAIGRFDSTPWLPEIDVPTSVVVTDKDSWVPTRRQRAMAAAIPGAEVFECHRSHAACVIGVEDFLPCLLAATDSVVRRIGAAAA
ncbi:MAG: alpha/beta fold hydrolase [Actinomycetes bacterium]